MPSRKKTKHNTTKRRKRHTKKRRQVADKYHDSANPLAVGSFIASRIMPPSADGALYPPIKPLKAYKMPVSKIHTIAFWTFGNPRGKPVLFVHGGPGSCTNPNHARFFNPKKYYIVLVDQRGCGQSKPTAELRENTTQNLVADFEKVRKFLGIEKWMIFGGSWGSTLSLVYSMMHPERATEIILRGIFLCSPPENNWIIEPMGAERFNPEAWDYYQNALPKKEQRVGNYLKAYDACFAGKYGAKKRDQCLLAWSAWEDSNSTLKKRPFAQVVADLKSEKKYEEMSAIEEHYFKNECFLRQNYFFDPRNLRKLQHKPVIIVQGLYDMVCPFISAYRLHQAIPHSEFYPTYAGHSAFELENIKYLVMATDRF